MQFLKRNNSEEEKVSTDEMKAYLLDRWKYRPNVFKLHFFGMDKCFGLKQNSLSESVGSEIGIKELEYYLGYILELFEIDARIDEEKAVQYIGSSWNRPFWIKLSNIICQKWNKLELDSNVNICKLSPLLQHFVRTNEIVQTYSNDCRQNYVSVCYNFESESKESIKRQEIWFSGKYIYPMLIM